MNGLKDKNNQVMISIDAEAFDTIQHDLIKILENVGLEGMYINIIKAIANQRHPKWRNA